MAINGINPLGWRSLNILGDIGSTSHFQPCLQFLLIWILILIRHRIFCDSVVQLIWCFVSCWLPSCSPSLLLMIESNTEIQFLNCNGCKWFASSSDCTFPVGMISVPPRAHITSIPISKSYPRDFSGSTSMLTSALLLSSVQIDTIPSPHLAC